MALFNIITRELRHIISSALSFTCIIFSLPNKCSKVDSQKTSSGLIYGPIIGLQIDRIKVKTLWEGKNIWKNRVEKLVVSNKEK